MPLSKVNMCPPPCIQHLFICNMTIDLTVMATCRRHNYVLTVAWQVRPTGKLQMLSFTWQYLLDLFLYVLYINDWPFMYIQIYIYIYIIFSVLWEIILIIMYICYFSGKILMISYNLLKTFIQSEINLIVRYTFSFFCFSFFIFFIFFGRG